MIESLHELPKGLGIFQVLNASVEENLTLIIGLLEMVDKLTADLHGESLDRDQEIVLRFDPFCLGSIKTACGDDQVKVGMKAHILVPGMKDSCKAYLCLEPFPISCQFEEGLGCGSKQDVVEDLFVVEDERIELVRERDDHMKILGGQDSTKSLFQPPCAL